MKKEQIAVIGGDMRMVYAARGLQAAGHSVSICKTAASLSEATVILLPMPLCRDGVHLYMPGAQAAPSLSEIFRLASPSARIFGGGRLPFADTRFLDYSTHEELAQRGALPTAEGALCLAIEKLSCTVSGSDVAVTGFGRVGKATAALFRAVGATVTVFARREEAVAVAALLGYHSAPLDELPEHMGDFRCLINTVPAPVIGASALCRARRDLLLLELSSPPYGIDLALASELGLTAVTAGGLPGKYSPETAGLAVSEIIQRLLREHT